MKDFKDKKNLSIQVISTLIVCVLCFGMGFMISNQMSKQSNSEGWKKLQTVYSILTEKWFYSDKVENLDTRLIEQAIEGMSILEEDAHTNYFSLEMAKQFSSTLEGSNVGVGFSYYVNQDKNFTVTKTFVNSPADLAGLQKGDIVVSVEDMECAKCESSDIVSMIKSSEGKKLNVKYIRDGKIIETKLIPTSYDATVSCFIEKDYGIIELSSFSEYSAKEFNESIQRIKNAGINKLIIDLRNNTGGYLKSVLDISSCLLPKDSVVFVEHQLHDKVEELKSSNTYEQTKFEQIVILQNATTASASEVLIGALKDHLKDIVQTVGTNSYGKGTEQVSIPFTDGTSIKYTVAEWSTPNGTCINLEGFKPDYEVNLDEVQTVKYASMKDDEVIKADSVHINAAALQTYLEFLGYKVDRKDEYFSVVSSKALMKYQEDRGFDVTGDCDNTTWMALKDEILLVINEKEDELDYQMLKAIELLK